MNALQPAPPAELADPRAFIDHPSGYLALSPRNARFTLAGVPGFISYRVRGRHAAMFGGVHAPPEAREALLDGFLAEAGSRKLGTIAVQIREGQTDLFRSRGFTVNRFGTTFGMKIRGFSMAGGKRMNLRNRIKRGKGAGLTVQEVGRELPADQATFDRLEAISSQWLGRKKKKELDFMIGELGEPGHPDRRIFTVADRAGQIIGFITYVPVFGERPGWLHDLTRRMPGSPAGSMELCNSVAIERLSAAGAEYLHFGFTPFVLQGSGEGPGASPVMAWIVRMLGRYGGMIYPARSQVEYKQKWSPEIVEGEYIALRPLSLRAILDLMVLTRSI